MAGDLPDLSLDDESPFAESFCHCWNSKSEKEPGNPDCSCGEELGVIKWSWQVPSHIPKWVDLYRDNKQVVFHPLYSSGTALAKGNIGLKHNVNYYWEIKMLTQPYGTDIMVGVGTNDIADTIRDYTTFLGGNKYSYGLSYTGAICQNSVVIDSCPGFCKGTIIGVMVDMFHGTLEFYLNRQPQGISFTDLRRHKTLFPMACSTAAQSAMRLTYASSWTKTLLVDAAKVLAASVKGQNFFKNMPPGLALTLKEDFWIPMPSAGKVLDDEKSERFIRKAVKERKF